MSISVIHGVKVIDGNHWSLLTTSMQPSSPQLLPPFSSNPHHPPQPHHQTHRNPSNIVGNHHRNPASAPRNPDSSPTHVRTYHDCTVDGTSARMQLPMRRPCILRIHAHTGTYYTIFVSSSIYPTLSALFFSHQAVSAASDRSCSRAAANPTVDRLIDRINVNHSLTNSLTRQHCLITGNSNDWQCNALPSKTAIDSGNAIRRWRLQQLWLQ